MYWLFIVSIKHTFYLLLNFKEQHVWSRKFKECGGKMQSPITLSTSKSIALPLPALEMVGFHDFLPHPLTLTNNGHSGNSTFDINLLVD